MIRYLTKAPQCGLQFAAYYDWGNEAVSSTPADQIIRFSVFEFDVRAGVLKKRGTRLPVQGLPLQVLAVLVEKPGEVVSREEIRSRLWPADTFVDFDHSLHNAIARLRDALDDSATTPRFVETLPRRGYRFIGALGQGPGEASTPGLSTEPNAGAVPSRGSLSVPFPPASPTTQSLHPGMGGPWMILAISAAVAAALAAAIWYGRRMERRPLPSLHRITYRRGTVWNARFTPDGNSVIYGAAWDGNPVEIYEGRLDSAEGRALGFRDADVLSVSSTGEMAILLNRKRGPSGFGFHGTLAQLPITGGTPRPIMERAESADWGPNGSLAVAYHSVGKARLEYPIGTLRYESATWLSDVRVSPKGDMVAFVEHDDPIGDSGMIRVIDSKGSRALTRNYGSAEGVAWSANGNEIWYTASDSGSGRCLRAVDLAGHERVLYRVPGALKLQDVAKNGRVLFVHELIHAGILGHVPGEPGERELGWLDWSIHRALSKDGKWLLFDESGDAPGSDSWIYLRPTDGSPAEKLGSGVYGDLSPEGKWVAAVPADFSGQVSLLPTGTGQARVLRFPSLRTYGVQWFPDGKHLAVSASESGKGTRIFMVDIDSGDLRPITPEGSVTRVRGAVTPDGKFVAARGSDGMYLFPVAGGIAKKIPPLEEGELIAGWSGDGQSAYVCSIGETSSNIYRIALSTGKRELFRTLSPFDKAGLTYLSQPTFTPDLRYYVYSYNRQISELFVGQDIQ